MFLKHIPLLTFFITTLGFSMNEQSNILQQLIPKNSVPHIEFITDDCALVNVHHMGIHHGCYMIDLRKNSLIKKIEFEKPFKKGFCCSLVKLSMHPHKKTFSLFKYKRILLYDAATGTLQKTSSIDYDPEYWDLTMYPTNNVILFWNTTNNAVAEWDYLANTLKNSTLDHVNQIRKIECHPTKEDYLVTNLFTGTMFFSKDKVEKIIGKILHPYSTYSPNGSFIAWSTLNIPQSILVGTTTPYKNYIYNMKYFKCNYIPKNKEEKIDAIEFHPNNKFLAISLTPNRRIEYFDIEEKKVSAFSKIDSITPYDYSSIIRFSRKGKRIAFTVLNDYFTKNIPFEVIYESKAKKLLPYFLWILTNYNIDQHNSLPQDVIYLIIKKTLKTFKY